MIRFGGDPDRSLGSRDFENIFIIAFISNIRSVVPRLR